MKAPQYLRDARHTDKFTFSLIDPLFYEPVETRYNPWEEYETPVTELLSEIANDWTFTRDGFWYFVHPKADFDMTLQGWKVHVSAAIPNAVSILQRTARIALNKKILFKFALDKNVLATMSSKRWARGGSGKFITLYPPDLEAFKDLLEALYAELRDEEGPYILSDKRYKDCRVLYYRYGGMLRNSYTDIKGEQVLVLVTPDGEKVRDVRSPYFAPPPWAEDPFPVEKVERPQQIVLNDRFVVQKAISFSNSGGVYVAEDRTTGKEVIIKEARPHTAMDDRGNDAIKMLKKEAEFLELLSDTGVAPKALDSFQAGEHFFLAEEYLDGIDIREIMLLQSPLMLVRPSLEESKQYYEIYRQICKAFAEAVDLLHKKGIVFGDLNARNIRIDPASQTVRLIDFEGAFKPGIDDPPYLFTPGFKSAASIHRNTQGFEDDLFALASNMFYMLFPLAAFSVLRADLFDSVIKTILKDVGWANTEVFNIINGLSKNEMTCARAIELLDKPAEIVAPSFADDVDADFCKETARELGTFILANVRPDRDDRLFPSDPFVHRTNPLGLGLGASGVLYTLKKCGFDAPKAATDWLEKKLDDANPNRLPPGLFTGSAGIAWCLSELGFEDRAVSLMNHANTSRLAKDHHSYLYGMAGIGMANLHFHARTGNSEYLDAATDLADSLLKTAQENDAGIFWENDGLLHLGYGYGQSGVALFLLRLSQVTGNERFLAEGRRALEFDLSHVEEREPGVLTFARAPEDPTSVPYIEEGSGGIAKVAMRYGLWDERLEKILLDSHRKYSGFVGLLYGTASFIDVFTDAYMLSNNPKYLEMAKRPITGIRDLYLMKQAQGIATPGDNLFRITCDYATGVAGVLRTLYRFAHLEHADFVLDEVAPAASKREAVQSAVYSVSN
jgi:tRNA A-37 threonylcarbamoyl transferase component Bud32